MAIAEFGSNTVMFGGSQVGSLGSTFLDDTWMWDGTDWTQITRFGPFGLGPHPSARDSAAMAYNPNTGEIVLFGGRGSSSDLGDTWIFSRSTTSTKLGQITSFNWTQVTSALSPSPREGAKMAYDPSSGRLVLHGGDGPANGQITDFNDTWVFDSGAWSPINQSGPPARDHAAMAVCAPNVNSPPRSALLFGGIQFTTTFNDTWAFFTPTFSGMLNWGEVDESKTPPPPARFHHAMAYYPVSKQIVMYGGGTGGAVFSDTWNAFCPSWAQANPVHNPGLRQHHGMATAQGGFTVVMFGGKKITNTVVENNETWTWGRRAACLPTDGSEIRVGTKVDCLFDNIDGVNFGGWTASGFGPPFRDDLKPTFHTNSPGPAAITAEWTDATGYHTQTYHYTIVRPNQ